jgi:hypothetical protein
MTATKETIKGFFNPRTTDDTFKGLGIAMGMDGTIADKIHRDLEQFLKAAGRDYFIKKVPAYQFIGDLDGHPQYAVAEDQFHLVRSADNRIVSPHTVSDSYAPLSLMDIAEEIAPWVRDGWATPDAVFSAKNGSLEVLVLRLDAGGEIADGDFYVHYIVIQNPHAVGGKAKGKIISFRIVCKNTFAAAVSAKSDFTISHRVAKGDHEEQAAIMQERAKDAIAAWEKVQTHIAELSKRVNVWTEADLTFADAKELTNQLVGIVDDEKASTRAKNTRDAIVGAFAKPEFGTYGRTAYDWINAVTFVNSSPDAEANKKSKVSPIDRAIRNVDPNGTGFDRELKAEKILAKFLA